MDGYSENSECAKTAVGVTGDWRKWRKEARCKNGENGGRTNVGLFLSKRRMELE
jgi:hypothetical protein